MVQQRRFTFESGTIGAGGFAKVYKGRDVELERDVAVKVLDPIVTAFPEEDQERFRREARTLAKFSHPNIPAIYDIDYSQGRFQIIFQFIDGVTLRELINTEGPANISQVRTWFSQVALALAYAHSMDIVHRDVKPENIIIAPNRETAYLVDFGIALSKEDADRLTGSGFIGTPGYMSPEQQSGEEVDARSDICSLGITMYEALAGRPISPGQYEDLTIMNESIPPEIDRLIQDSIVVKERRIASANEFNVRLAGAFRTQRPLSQVLATGRLYDIALALEPLSSEEFASLPAGQRSLILIKLRDIVDSSNPQLQRAAEHFLELLLTKGLLINKEDYREIIKPAGRWGFEEQYGGFLGSRNVRRAIVDAASQARADIHEIMSEELIEYFDAAEIDLQQGWYLSAGRDILQSLLANPNCDKASVDLGRILRNVNDVQRGRYEVGIQDDDGST